MPDRDRAARADEQATSYASAPLLWRKVLFSRLFLIMMIAGMVCGSSLSALAKAKALPWKAVEDALLRVNDVAVKDWSVYQTGKKTDPLLLQIGSRFFLIEVHDRRLFELDPSKIQHKSDELFWDPSDHPADPITTSDWVNNDIGGAFRIGAKLDAENRVLDLQLPHPLDVGMLPARTATPTRRRGSSLP